MIIHFRIQGAFEFFIEIRSRIGAGQHPGVLAVDSHQHQRQHSDNGGHGDGQDDQQRADLLLYGAGGVD